MILNRRTKGQNATLTTASTETGITIVEALIAVLAISIVLLITAQLGSVSATMLSLTARQRLADGQATSVVSKLVAQKSADYSAALIVNPTGTVSLGTLQAGYFDYVVAPDPMAKATPVLPASCGAWPCAVEPGAQPTSTTVLFVRAWNVSTRDSARGLRDVRAAVFPGAVLDQNADRTAISHRLTRVIYR